MKTTNIPGWMDLKPSYEFNANDVYTTDIPHPHMIFNPRKIEKIVIKNPHVTLVDIHGQTWKVKARGGDEFDPVIGVLLVLCKYMFSSRRYSEILEIFDALNRNRIIFLAGAIIPIIGLKTYRYIEHEADQGYSLFYEKKQTIRLATKVKR